MTKKSTARTPRKRPNPARKASGAAALSKYQSPKEIVQLWLDSINDALKYYNKQHLTDDIVAAYRPLLEGFVADHIGKKNQFTKKDENVTKRVARDLGHICDIVTTTTDTIEKKTFEYAFALVQNCHDVCRVLDANGNNRGAWCGGGS